MQTSSYSTEVYGDEPSVKAAPKQQSEMKKLNV